ncbi:MAG: hypothetical protein DA328_07520 [Nitrososphaeraceae archaeon]|nr:hypothetical protein [Nitrososphaeraceae archaeon]
MVEAKKSLLLICVVISGTLVGILFGMLIEKIDDNKFHINMVLKSLPSDHDILVIRPDLYDDRSLTTK